MIPKDKTQMLRHIFIDKKIREGMRTGQLPSSVTLAKEYEVSPKSILRDIDYLKHQCDAPIEYDPRKKGFYYTEDNYKMPAVNINASDLFAICIAEKALKQHEDTPIYPKLVSIFRKIQESLPEKVSIHPSWIDNRISIIQQSKTSIIPEIWSIVSDALQRSRTLAMTYRKPHQDYDSSREVDPYHLINFQGEWYLVAYCRLRQKILTFSVSRIRKAKITIHTFPIPSDFDFEKTTARFGIFSSDQTYKIRIKFYKKHAPYVLEREWHPSQKITKNSDGSLILELTANHLFEIRQWILSWGSGVEALEPPQLVKEIKKELQDTLQGYLAS